MKTVTLAVLASLVATIPLATSASEPTAVSPPARTSSLFASGEVIPVRQLNVEVNTRPNGYRNQRRYRTVKVVKYRHGVRYVSYRRVYY